MLRSHKNSVEAETIPAGEASASKVEFEPAAIEVIPELAISEPEVVTESDEIPSTLTPVEEGRTEENTPLRREFRRSRNLLTLSLSWR